jgi:hypothetical protein
MAEGMESGARGGAAARESAPRRGSSIWFARVIARRGRYDW